MAGLAPLIGEMLGVERAPIEVVEDGLRHSVRIGDAIDFEIEDIVPFGVETGEPVRFDGMFHPVGSDLTMPRRSARRSTPSASSTRGRPGCRRPSSPGPPERLIASTRTSALPAPGASRPPSRPRASRLGLVALLFALAAVGWWWTVGRDAGHGRRALDRSRDARLVPRRLGRDDGGDDVPVGRADGRAVLAHDEEPLAGRTARSSPPAISLTWASAGVLAFAIATVGGRVAGDVLAWDRAGRWIAGATLVVAAVYELTPLKDVCLGKCRSPLGFLLGSWRDGRSGALRMGARHGAWCVGCCWALMASLFALGVMSIAWMAFVAGLIAIEKLIPSRRAATYGTAAILLVLGVLCSPPPTRFPRSPFRGAARCLRWTEMSP